MCLLQGQDEASRRQPLATACVRRRVSGVQPAWLPYRQISVAVKDSNCDPGHTVLETAGLHIWFSEQRVASQQMRKKSQWHSMGKARQRESDEKEDRVDTEGSTEGSTTASTTDTRDDGEQGSSDVLLL